MTLTNLLDFMFKASLLVHVVLIAFAIWRIWKGKDVIDRLIGVDLVGTLFLAVLVLLALIFSDVLYIDVALALAALGFISLVALAKYVADEQMF